LEKLKNDDRSLTQAPINTLASRQARVQAKLDQARANQRISEAIYQDLRTELERVAARERLYKADGQLDIVVANDLEQINELQQSLTALPDLNSKKDKQ
jgi:hypothetical protein